MAQRSRRNGRTMTLLVVWILPRQSATHQATRKIQRLSARLACPRGVSPAIEEFGREAPSDHGEWQVVYERDRLALSKTLCSGVMRHLWSVED